MAIQINTDSLTKSHQFIFEACKILWQHKRVFFAFAALPMMLDVVGNILLIQNSMETRENLLNVGYNAGGKLDHGFITFLKFFIGFPLFSIAWFRYILDLHYKAAFKSYFFIDRAFLDYLFLFLPFIFLFSKVWPYLFLVLALLMPTPISKTFGFLYLQGVDFTLLLMLPLFSFGWLVLYRILPIIVLLPMAALKRIRNVRGALSKTSPSKLEFSIILIALFCILTLESIGFSMITDTFILNFKKLSDNKLKFITGLLCIGDVMLRYVTIGLILTLTSVYYKKYILDGK